MHGDDESGKCMRDDAKVIIIKEKDKRKHMSIVNGHFYKPKSDLDRYTNLDGMLVLDREILDSFGLSSLLSPFSTTRLSIKACYSSLDLLSFSFW